MSYRDYTETLFEPRETSIGRSRSYKNIPSPSFKNLQTRQHIPSANSLHFPKTESSSRNLSSISRQELGQDIVKILREENLNLKDQNHFLLEKLRLLATKQQEALELSEKHQAIYQELKNQNLQLRQQLKYVNQLAHSKVEEFGKKLAKISKEAHSVAPESNIQLKDLNPPHGILQLQQAFSENEKHRSMKQGTKQDQRIWMQEQCTRDVVRSLQDLNSEFEAILYSCKVQKNNQKRKQYRRRLVELTAKMKLLKK